jgi:hypothetical protein
VEFQENEKEIDDKGKHLEFQVFLRDEESYLIQCSF